MANRLTREEFIEKARKVHGDKYDYSLIEYKNNKTKVKIICPTHGVFEQTPEKHFNGRGCQKCGGSNKSTTEEFVKRAKEIHGDKYDYSLVEYKNNKTKVKIVCPTHGVFEQKPNDHKSGYGCIKCAKEYVGRLNSMPHEEFIEKARKVHGDKYDYSKTKYINSTKKVKIICPVHGEFEQAAYKHIQNRGCPSCSESSGEKTIRLFLENNKIKYSQQMIFKDIGSVNNGFVRFDFYLPDYNTCIEFDGIQHFEPIDFFGGEEALLILQKNDKLKNEYCLEKNIKLIRVKYNEEIIEALSQILYTDKLDKDNIKN